MSQHLKRALRGTAHFIIRGASDFGTVCLGASAIFLTRVFPSFVCADCNDFDLAMLVVCAIFFSVGMLLRFLGQDAAAMDSREQDSGE